VFTQKLLSVQISLAQGTFGAGGNSTTITAVQQNGEVGSNGSFVSGPAFGGGALATILRMSAHIDSVGGVSSGLMDLAIYGLPLETMNQLSTIGSQATLIDKNTISLSAGDSASGMTLVFSGLIDNAFVDANSMPQVCFRITAVPGGAFYAVQPVTPISLQGSQDVAQMLGKIAGQMGLSFENNGVNVKLSNPYYSGSPWGQAVAIARHANVEMVVDRGVLAISPNSQPRTTGGIPLISASTGMVGYPAFRQAVIVVRSLFNPAVQVNGQIQVQSTLTPANGTWMVFHIIYELECAMPHGRWYQTMEAQKGSPPGPS
jgi:hypothetical protein